MTRIQKISTTGRMTPKPIKRKKETLNTHSKKTKKILVPALCCLAITGIVAIGLTYKKRKINIPDLKKTPNLNDKTAQNQLNPPNSEAIKDNLVKKASCDIEKADENCTLIRKQTPEITSESEQALPPSDNKIIETASQTSTKTPLQDVSKETITAPEMPSDNKIIETMLQTKDGAVTKTVYNNEGKIHSRETIFPDGQKCQTCYNNQIKIIETKNLPASYKSKTYIKQGGKHVILRRENHEVFKNSHKIVEHFPDGTTKITLTDNEGSKIIFKDRKGNTITPDIAQFKAHIEKDADLINNGTASLSSGWYKEYQNLCKKYNEFQRPLGIPCGANDHYFELLQRDMGSEAWAEYLKIEQFRTSYDDNARLMKYLREEDNSKIFNNQKLTAEDTQTLINSDAKSFLNGLKTIHIESDDELNIQKTLHNIAQAIKEENLQEVNSDKKPKFFERLSKFFNRFSKKYQYID